MAQKLFYFNPTAELAIKNGNKSYQPPRVLSVFEEDLACLPFVFANEHDAVFVPTKPSDRFLEHLCALQISLPSFLSKEDLVLRGESVPFALMPWANSPNLPAIFPRYNYCEKKGIPNLQLPLWESSASSLFRRESSFDLWQLLSHECAIPMPKLPVFCKSMAELENAIAGNNRSVVKLNYSSSGRGVFFVSQSIDPCEKARISKNICDGAIVEPWYENVADLSLQFRVNAGNAEFVGATQMFTDGQGRYAGTMVNAQEIHHKEEVFCLETMLSPFVNAYLAVLPRTIYCSQYAGPLGIDVLAYETADGISIHPLVEVNTRYTMGMVALRLAPHIDSGSCAVFFVEKRTAELDEMFEKKPTIANGKLVAGYVPLTDWVSAKQFVAYLYVVPRS